MVLNILKPDLIMIACICAVVSFFITYLAMPRLIKKLQDAKIVGKDISRKWLRWVVLEFF